MDLHVSVTNYILILRQDLIGLFNEDCFASYEGNIFEGILYLTYGVQVQFLKVGGLVVRSGELENQFPDARYGDVKRCIAYAILDAKLMGKADIEEMPDESA